MSINWFPGHMNKTRQQLAAMMPQCDVVVELLDARLPASSRNPLIDELRQNVVGKGPDGKPGVVPCITVLNKRDLADPEATAQWRATFERDRGVKTLAMCANQPKQTDAVVALIRRLASKRIDKGQKARVMVVGIPNVGKSTLVNALRGKRVANVGDEPAVTKGRQEIDLKNGIVLVDTPGILWPRFDDPQVGYRLAASGAIKDTAMDYDDVAIFTARYLTREYGSALQERYGLEELSTDPVMLIEDIGRRRGCLIAGGEVDFNRAGELLLREMRSGKLGRVSLEWPGQGGGED